VFGVGGVPILVRGGKVYNAITWSRDITCVTIAAVRDVPAAVRAKAREAGAVEWLAELPGLVGEMARKWDLTVGAAFGDATEAYVAAAIRGDGTPAVLKLLVPRPGGHATHEITVLRLAGGRGCVRLLAADESSGALLLERLGPAMSDLDLPQPRRLEILTDLAGAVWRRLEDNPPAAPRADAGLGAGVGLSADAGRRADVGLGAGVGPGADAGRQADAGLRAVAGLPTGAAKAARLAEYIPRKWAELGEPCTARAVEQAVAAAERRRRAYDPQKAVLVHGDVHQWNALRSGDGFRLVDPDGLLAEPECDLGVLMREDPVELLAGDPWDRARHLAARTGTDPAAIWDWGLADRVATGLALTAVGLQPVAAQMLAAAELI
jgi:streptomycin 6-kinase